MAYWPVVPLALSVALLTYALATGPRTRSHLLYAAMLSCTILHAVALLLLSQPGRLGGAPWLAGLRYLVAVPLPDLLAWRLIADLIAREGEPPPWVHAITAGSLVVHGVVAVIAGFDLSGQTAIFYRDLAPLPEQGYALTHSALHIIPQLARLLPLGGVWAGLVAVFWRQDRQRQVFTGAGLLLAIALPLATHLASPRIHRPLVGLASAGEIGLALGLGYVLLQARFTPVLRSAFQVAAHSTAGWIVLDSAGNVLHLNQAAAGLLGVEARSVRYAPYDGLLARALPAEAREALSTAIAVRPTPYQAEVSLLDPAGLRTVQAHVTPLHDATGRAIGKTIQLTETTALRGCQEQLSQIQRARAAIEETLNRAWGPALHVGGGVVVCPLAGPLDGARIAHILARLMDAARMHHARVVLLDMHALPALAPTEASALLEGVDALSLLGAQICWVGIQPAVAQILEERMPSLDELCTFPDLPSALTYWTSPARPG